MDEKDGRSNGLLSLIHIWGQLSNPPSAAFLENVRGFEDSIAHRRLIRMLRSRGYTTEEYIASPTHLGIPNSRVRYYLIAYLSSDPKLSPKYVAGPDQDDDIPPNWEMGLPINGNDSIQSTSSIQPISLDKYLLTHEEELNTEGGIKKYLADKKDLERLERVNFRVDVGVRSSLCTTTITKHYLGALGKGGPLLACSAEGHVLNNLSDGIWGDADLEVDDCSEKEGEIDLSKRKKIAEETVEMKKNNELITDVPKVEKSEFPHYTSSLHIDGTSKICRDRFKKLNSSSGTHLRTLTERELLRLAGFPEDFCFPASISYKSACQLVGNSINVTVVGVVLSRLVKGGFIRVDTTRPQHLKQKGKRKCLE